MLSKENPLEGNWISYNSNQKNNKKKPNKKQCYMNQLSQSQNSLDATKKQM